MKQFSVSRVINSSPNSIWEILTNAPAWPEWNPTIDKVDGVIAPGERITVYSKVNPGRPFPLNVSEFSPPHRMVWSGGMPLGLFKGERTYTLDSRPDGSVEFTMREEFTGLLAPLITRSIPDLQPSFDAFAAALKKCAEKTTERGGSR
jgi:hypothetical protein